jgi:hypothetical protein
MPLIGVFFYGFLSFFMYIFSWIFLTAKKLKRVKKDRLVSNKTNQRIKTRELT